jgi:hypothetical protein
MKKIALFAFIACIVPALTAARADDSASNVLELKEKIIELQNQGTLGIKNLSPCSQITTIGSYTPILEAKFKQNEFLLVYFEPLNFSTARPNGMYEVWLTEDMLILDEKVQTLLEKPGVVQTHYTSASPILDIYFNNRIEFESVPAGKYILKVVLYDKIKNTSASESLPFEVVEEEKPQTKQE